VRLTANEVGVLKPLGGSNPLDSATNNLPGVTAPGVYKVGFDQVNCQGCLEISTKKYQPKCKKRAFVLALQARQIARRIKSKASFDLILLAFVAQRIEHLTTDQKVGGSSPSKRTEIARFSRPRYFFTLRIPFRFRSATQITTTIQNWQPCQRGNLANLENLKTPL
jgi:hypothetical protein